MNSEKAFPQLSEFMHYLARSNGIKDRLPSLAALSQELDISIATLREQLEVARALGLVEVRPKTGIRKLPYTFTPAVLRSLSYATAVDPAYFFNTFADLRTHIEAAYWQKAITSLGEEDHIYLRSLVTRAFDKLNGSPIEIPHEEHRELHLSIYRRLDNPFVTGILEAYWDAYEAVGLNLYTDIQYLKNVWSYHQRMVEAICHGDITAGYHALLEHADLIHERPVTTIKPFLPRQKFE